MDLRTQPVTPTAEPTTRDRRPVGSQRVLIVEDESKVAFFLQESLEALDGGPQVVSVPSAEEALHELTYTTYEVLVTDLRMPGMNGLELIRRAQEMQPGITTILITAYGSDEVQAEAAQLGVFHYFAKPFHIDDFVETVLKALQQSRPQPDAPLTRDQADRVAHRLEELRQRVGAQGAFLADETGRLLVRQGSSMSLNEEELLGCARESFLSAGRMARYLGEKHVFNLNYYQGTVYDLYTAGVGERFFLTLTFDRRVRSSQIGLVWLYTRQTVEQLVPLLAATGEMAQPSRPDSPKPASQTISLPSPIPQAGGLVESG